MSDILEFAGVVICMFCWFWVFMVVTGVIAYNLKPKQPPKR